MALSNIFNEPRREITETVVGLGVVGSAVAGFLSLDYATVRWLEAVYGEGRDPFVLKTVLVGILLGFCGSILVGLLFLTHAAGDNICTALERRGVQMRPRQRR